VPETSFIVDLPGRQKEDTNAEKGADDHE